MDTPRAQVADPLNEDNLRAAVVALDTDQPLRLIVASVHDELAGMRLCMDGSRPADFANIHGPWVEVLAPVRGIASVDVDPTVGGPFVTLA